MLALFDALPRLAALGLKSYRFNARRDGSNVNITGREAFFTEPTTGLPFQYAQMVDFAPMALLRSAFRHVSVWCARATIRFKTPQQSVPDHLSLPLTLFSINYTGCSCVTPALPPRPSVCLTCTYSNAGDHDALLQVGGLDEGLSETGMCGIYSDFEISVRFWAAGWHVGFHPIAGTKPDQSGVPSGTHKPETEFRCWRRQMGLSGAVYFKRWVGDARPQLMQESLALTVRSMNLKRLQRVPNMHCPWSAAFGACDPHWAPTTLQ